MAGINLNGFKKFLEPYDKIQKEHKQFINNLYLSNYTFKGDCGEMDRSDLWEGMERANDLYNQINALIPLIEGGFTIVETKNQEDYENKLRNLKEFKEDVVEGYEKCKRLFDPTDLERKTMNSFNID